MLPPMTPHEDDGQLREGHKQINSAKHYITLWIHVINATR